MRIGSLEVGGEYPCRIVAEMSNNHNGDRDQLGRMIDAAQHAGADAIKIQSYTPDELVALRGDGAAPEPWGRQGWSMRDLYTKAQTPLDWLPKIAAHCERVGMPWFSSVFGAESLAALEAVGCPAYKISRLDNCHEWLRDAAHATGKPVVVSVGHEDFPVYHRAADSFLYCPPGYPPPPGAVQLPPFDRDYRGHRFLGLSSHCLAPELLIAAVARGAKLIEMHFMLRDEPSELEANISLDEYQFAAMVKSVRATETLLG